MRRIARTTSIFKGLSAAVLAASALAFAPGAAAEPSVSGPLAVTDLEHGLTIDDLAAELAGEGIEVIGTAFEGLEASAGTFSGGADSIGIDGGVVLSSGLATDALGPNDSSGTSVDTELPGMPVLDELSGFPTYNATALSIDLVPNADELFFDYVFASEEYDEYVNTQFNDVFAFFVTGPAATQPVNCAVLEDGSPVSVNTINNGNPDGDTTATNPALHRSNTHGEIDAEPDGFTVVLRCAAKVTPLVSNTLTLAIADASDPVLDSWVFIAADSLTTIETEICDNSLDDDGDDLVDSDDPDCPPAAPTLARTTLELDPPVQLSSKRNLRLTVQLQFAATLTSEGVAVAGAPVEFTTPFGRACTALTDANGRATCAFTVSSLLGTVVGLGHGASYAGDDAHAPSAAATPLARVLGLDVVQ